MSETAELIAAEVIAERLSGMTRLEGFYYAMNPTAWEMLKLEIGLTVLARVLRREGK